MKALAFAAVLGAFALPASAAFQTADFGSYSVTYDDASVLGGISFSSTGSGNTVGFGWTLPDSLVVNDATTEFVLPSFTVVATPGYTLSGALTGFIGNLSYSEFGSGESGAWISGTVSINGSPLIPFSELLDRTTQLSLPSIRSGYYSLGGTQDFGSFSSLVVSNLTLTLSASSTAVVSGNDQGELRIGFVAAPVPEADTYAMLLAGLGIVSLVARRRLPR